MHRVELKEKPKEFHQMLDFQVPNAPCGVERPNQIYMRLFLKRLKFLMHRVELKVRSSITKRTNSSVPNAPCGVERKRYSLTCLGVFLRFLMHRVELKACYTTGTFTSYKSS